MRILFALLSLGVGVALLIEGYRIARILIPLMGFLTGLSLGGAIISDNSSTPFLSTTLGIVLGILFGLVFAAMAYFYYYLAVIVLAAGLGYWAGSGFILLLGFSPGVLSVLLGIALGIATGIFAILARAPKYVLIALTSIAGAVAAVGGVLLLFNQIPLDTFNYHTINVALSNSFLWTLATLILLAMGIALQVSTTQQYTFEEWSPGDDHLHHTPPTTKHLAGGGVH